MSGFTKGVDPNLPAAPRCSSKRSASSSGDASGIKICCIVVITDGRVCKMCGCKDTDDDPVDAALHILLPEHRPVPMAWFTGKARHRQKNEGLICFYCYAVFNCRHKHTGATTKTLLEALGTDGEAMRQFKSRRDGCIAWCVEHGGREGRINWAVIDQKVLTLDTEWSTNYEDPIDEHWDYSEYVKEKGSPETNGLNHQVATVKGRKVVVVPGRKIWKVRRSHTQKVKVSQTMDTGGQNFTDHQVDEKATELVDMMRKFMPQAHGALGHDMLSASLASLLFSSDAAMSATPATVSSASIASPRGSVAASARDEEKPTSLFSLGFGFDASGQAGHPLSTAAGKPTTRARAFQVPAGATGANASASGAAQQSPEKSQGPTPGSDQKKRRTGEAVPKAVLAQEAVLKGIKGRPQKDPITTTDSTCKEFAETQPSFPTFASWFGTSFKANRRVVKRVCESLAERINKTDEKAEWESYSCQKKRLDAIIAVVDFASKNGVDHEGLFDVMESQDHFLALPPKAVVQWPTHLEQHRAQHRVRKSKTGADFIFGVKDLASKLPVDEQVPRQTSLTAEKVIGLIKDDDVVTALRNFFPASVTTSGLHADVAKQLDDVKLVAWYDDFSGTPLEDHCKRLELAVAHAGQTSLQISSALMVLPAGRSLVADAGAFAKKGLSTTMIVYRIVSLAAQMKRDIIDSFKGPFVLIDGLIAINKEVQDAEGGAILHEEFARMVRVTISNAVYDVAEYALAACLDSVLGPLFSGAVAWDVWSEVNTHHIFRFPLALTITFIIIIVIIIVIVIVIIIILIIIIIIILIIHIIIIIILTLHCQVTASDKSRAAVFAQIDCVSQCTTVCLPNWSTEHQSLLAVLFRLRAMAKLLASLPSFKTADDIRADALQLKPEMECGLGLSEVEALPLPSEFITLLATFESEQFFPKRNQIVKLLNAEVEA